MDSIVELVKRNEQLLLENAEALNDEEVEQEDIDEYLKIRGQLEVRFPGWVIKNTARPGFGLAEPYE